MIVQSVRNSYVMTSSGWNGHTSIAVIIIGLESLLCCLQ